MQALVLSEVNMNRDISSDNHIDNLGPRGSAYYQALRPNLARPPPTNPTNSGKQTLEVLLDVNGPGDQIRPAVNHGNFTILKEA